MPGLRPGSDRGVGRGGAIGARAPERHVREPREVGAQQVALAIDTEPDRTLPDYQRRDRRPHQNDGRDQSLVGHTKNAWRAPHTRDRCRRAHRLSPAPEAVLTLVADLAHVPRQPRPDLVSIDFFTVPTAGLRVLFVFVVLAHHRRGIVHFNVTQHPTARLDGPADRGRLPQRHRAVLLLRDRDTVYGSVFRRRVKRMGIGEVRTAPYSPWQNLFVERVIGSVRRVPRPYRGARRAASASHTDRVLRVLSSRSDSSFAREGCARREAHRAAGKGPDPADSRSRWPPSSICPAGGVSQPRPGLHTATSATPGTVLPSGHRPSHPEVQLSPWRSMWPEDGDGPSFGPTAHPVSPCGPAGPSHEHESHVVREMGKQTGPAAPGLRPRRTGARSGTALCVPCNCPSRYCRSRYTLDGV